jgi:hypothetical protein
LSDALDDQPFDLGGPWQRRDLLFKAVEQLVRKGLAELKGAAKQVVERRNIGDSAAAVGSLRERSSHRHAVLVERASDILL